MKTRFEFLKKNANIMPLLNIGCAGERPENTPSREIEQYFTKKNVINLDISPGKLKRAKLANSVIANALQLPIADFSIGSVYLGLVIEHIWEPYRLLQEAFRVLKRDGIIVLATPNVYYWYRIWLYLTGSNTLGDYDHKIIYSRDSLRLMLEKAGFRNIQFGFKGGLGCLSTIIMATAQKISSKSPKYRD